MCLIIEQRNTEETDFTVLLIIFFPPETFSEEENTAYLKTVLQGKIHFIVPHRVFIYTLKEVRQPYFILSFPFNSYNSRQKNQLFPLSWCRESTSTCTNSYNLAERLKMPHRKFEDPEVQCQIHVLPIIHYCLHYHYFTIGCHNLRDKTAFRTTLIL